MSNTEMYRGYRVFKDTSASGANNLIGLRDTIINVPYYAYIKMSQEFKEQCKTRNIQVRILYE